MSQARPRQPTWRKSSHSGREDCVELRLDQDSATVRDSKSPEGPQLTFTPTAFSSFLNAAKENRLTGH
jgi:hypothetical protein